MSISQKHPAQPDNPLSPPRLQRTPSILEGPVPNWEIEDTQPISSPVPGIYKREVQKHETSSTEGSDSSWSASGMTEEEKTSRQMLNFKSRCRLAPRPFQQARWGEEQDKTTFIPDPQTARNAIIELITEEREPLARLHSSIASSCFPEEKWIQTTAESFGISPSRHLDLENLFKQDWFLQCKDTESFYEIGSTFAAYRRTDLAEAWLKLASSSQVSPTHLQKLQTEITRIKQESSISGVIAAVEKTLYQTGDSEETLLAKMVRREEILEDANKNPLLKRYPYWPSIEKELSQISLARSVKQLFGLTNPDRRAKLSSETKEVSPPTSWLFIDQERSRIAQARLIGKPFVADCSHLKTQRGLKREEISPPTPVSSRPKEEA